MTRFFTVLILGMLPATAGAQSMGATWDWASEDFFASDGNPDLVDPSGTTLASNNDWLIQLFVTTDNNMNPFDFGTDDMPLSGPLGDITTTVNDEMNAGRFHRNLVENTDTTGTIDGLKVFTVIVNATTVAAATQWAIIDDSLITIAGGNIDAGDMVVGDWQPATCPSGEYWGATGCLACDASCDTCDGGTANDCTGCAMGEYLDAGVCVMCGSGACGAEEWYDANACGGGNDGCTDCSLCVVGEYAATTCAAAADTVCAACSAISSCAGTVTCTATTDSQCPMCSAGTYLVEGTADSCATCTACPAGTYASAACGGTSDTTCTNCPGVAECTTAITCTSAMDAQCGACSANYYLLNGTSDICAPCAVCGTDLWVAAACTTTTNTVCATCDESCNGCSGNEASDCVNCATGYWDSAGICTACSVCDAEQTEETACSSTADTVCAGPGSGSGSGTGDGDGDSGCQTTQGSAFAVLGITLLFWRRRRVD